MTSLSLHCRFVGVNCFEHAFVCLALHCFTTNQLFYRVLTHFRQVNRPAYTNCADLICYRNVRNYLLRSPVLGSLELQRADLVAFLPLPVCFLTHIAKLSGSDV